MKRSGRIGLRSCRAGEMWQRGSGRCQTQELPTGKFHDVSIPRIQKHSKKRAFRRPCIGEVDAWRPSSKIAQPKRVT